MSLYNFFQSGIDEPDFSIKKLKILDYIEQKITKKYYLLNVGMRKSLSSSVRMAWTSDEILNKIRLSGAF